MKSVENIFPPDPLYDHPGVPYPERAWIIVTRETAEAVGEVVELDFSQRSLKKIHNEPLLSKSLKDVTLEEIENFIKNYYLVGLIIWVNQN